MEKYKVIETKNRELESELRRYEYDNETLKKKEELIKMYEKKEKELEEKISDLCEQPFIKNDFDRDNAFKHARELELAISELQKRFKETEDKCMEYQIQNKELNEQLILITNERDRYKDDGMKYKISNEEREKQNKDFETQFKIIGQFGKVDSDYEKIANMLQRKYEEGNVSSNDNEQPWENIDFINKENGNDVEMLQHEIKRLKLEKGILGNELEKTKTLLQNQLQINEDMKTVQDITAQKHQKEINLLQSKITDLLSLVDKERIPKEYMNVNVDNMHKLIDTVPQHNESMRSLDDKITEFSYDLSESTYHQNENAVDLVMLQGDFDVDAIKNTLGIANENDIMTFISVDFYFHETQTSNLVNGVHPNYNLQLTFKVDEDERLIEYFTDECIVVDVYCLLNEEHIHFGKGTIQLNQLIVKESGIGSRVVKGYCDVKYVNNDTIKIGSIKYKMRMRNSIKDMLKWMRNKMEALKEKSDVVKASLKMEGYN
jgi:protein fantom